MNHSKVALLTSQIIEKVQLIIGVIMLSVFGICTLVSLVDKKIGSGGFLWFCIVIDVIGVMFIVFSRKRKKLVFYFKEYVKRLSVDPSGSIDNLARSMNQPQDKVRTDLEKMIAKKYFMNAYIDGSQNRIVFPAIHNVELDGGVITNASVQDNVEYVTATCKSCGGINKVTKGKVCECDYCGSPLSA